ncbi:TBC1 domain family member 2A [Pimephales promelas]|uniref:TBC1 domain family member 2A n=1 Tax=Pimephales promelas TaxID=90988 RepID=UPI001955ADD7|nr:TBC1 domain family member 2A [Pimephales promelas]XP_039504817.1 TBC1 domain family member 2A [Pimephales promelas]KAG1962351.1 TBC1 domain family member 2A [Pimephales promelas]
MESTGSSSTLPPPPDMHVSLVGECVGAEENQQQSLGQSDGAQAKEVTDIHAAQPDGTSATFRRAHVQSGSKLCGYLNKQGGPLKAWKSRWFAYEEKSCQLFYYRMAQDINPLGKVDLSRATFSYPLQGEEGTFHIQTPERTFILKAANRDTQMYWLQQLQLKRALFREKHAEHQSMPRPDNLTVESTPSANCPANFLPMVKTPSGLVGEEAASLPAPGLNNPLNMSIKHPLIELQNTMHSFRNRQSQEIRQSVFHIDDPNDNQKTPSSKTHTLSVPTPRSSQTPESPSNARCVDLHKNNPSTVSQNRKSWKEKFQPLELDRSQLQHEKLSLAEEVKAQKELVLLLHKVLEDAQLEKRTCAQFLAAEGEQERLELLRHGERRAAKLRDHLESLQQENENLRRDLNQRDSHVAELQESVQLLMHKNQAKQEVILKLSEKLAACGEDQHCTNGLETETFKQLTLENMHLKDDLKAYKTQNQYLNSEIYQLTTLWRKSSEQEQSLIVKCAVLEANNCQMESRYLGILQKLQESEELNPELREAIKKVLKDAVQADLNAAIKINPISEYDEYGFKIAVDYKVEDLKLLAKIQALEIRSQNLLNHEECDGPLLARCAQLLFGRPEAELSSSTELKGLLRTGLPREYRVRVWRFMIQTRTKTLRERHPDRYQELCEKSRTSPHLVPRQIQLDLDRTLTTNQYFSPPSSPLIQKLERVLQAFSWQNPTIGYVQGLNRLAAIALLVLQDEEDAFWCLVVVVEYIMPHNYYTKDLLGCQADQRVLKDLMSEKLPRLTAHLEALKVDVSLITVEWFLVLFVETLPTRILFKVWDTFLYEGIKVIFRYALALFKYREEDILKIQDSVEMYQYLRIFPITIADGRKLTSIAFNDMNPLPMKLLRNRRAVHLEQLRTEIRELENLQNAYKAEHVRCKDKELDTLASEDEEEV